MLNLKALLSEVLAFIKSHSFQSLTITPSVGSLVTYQHTKCGDVRNLALVLKKTSQTAVGANMLEASATPQGERPYHVVNGLGYYGSCCCVAQFTASGNITVRVTGATLPANAQVYVSLTYIARGGVADTLKHLANIFTFGRGWVYC